MYSPILKWLAATFKVRGATSNAGVAEAADHLFVVVPLVAVLPVLRELAPALPTEQTGMLLRVVSG